MALRKGMKILDWHELLGNAGVVARRRANTLKMTVGYSVAAESLGSRTKVRTARLHSAGATASAQL